MLTLINIQACERKKPDGTLSKWFELLCSDDYDNGHFLAGSPTKIVRCSEYVLNKALGGDQTVNMIKPESCNVQVGQAVYVMYNERGYVCYIRFYDPAEKSRSGYNSAPAPASVSAPASTPEEYPDFDEVVS